MKTTLKEGSIKMILIKQHKKKIIYLTRAKWLTAELGDVSINDAVTLLKYFDYGIT